MSQKFCARCTKPLTPNELARDQIQCAACYERWLKESLPAAEPVIMGIVARLQHEHDKKD